MKAGEVTNMLFGDILDEDVSLDVLLPLTMDEIYNVRDRIYEHVAELQEKYGVIIQASAVPSVES